MTILNYKYHQKFDLQIFDTLIFIFDF